MNVRKCILALALATSLVWFGQGALAGIIPCGGPTVTMTSGDGTQSTGHLTTIDDPGLGGVVAVFDWNGHHYVCWQGDDGDTFTDGAGNRLWFNADGTFSTAPMVGPPAPAGNYATGQPQPPK